MVQQLVRKVKDLEDEIRRIRGELNGISIGGKIIPSSIPGGVQLPLPIEGALLYGTGVPDWARLAIGDEGEVLTVDGGLPGWRPASSTSSSGGGMDGEEGPEGPMGPPGPVGPSGAAGTIGPMGPMGAILWMDPEEPEMAMPMPGIPGPAGANGAAGAQGIPGFSGPMHDEIGSDEPLMLPPGSLLEQTTLWVPDAPPASRGSDDDEFADASGGVPGGWTEVDHGTGMTVTEDEAGLKLTSTAGAGNAGIYKAIPAGDFTIWTKVSISGIGLTDFIPAGLVLWENAASSTGDLRVFYIESSAAQVAIIVQSWTAYNVHSANLFVGLISVDILPSHVYLRIRRTSSTYAFEYSTDGIGWLRVYNTAALGITPAHYGPAINTNSHATTVIVGRFPFFRYVASDVGSGGLMSGDRVVVGRR